MATSKEFHDYVVDCLSRIGEIKTRKMMGEYCIYYQGKLIGDICDNRLLFKQTETSKRLLTECKLEYPYEGSKTLMYVMEEIENIDFMEELLNGMFEELPESKKRK